jgi:hypothetical protein
MADEVEIEVSCHLVGERLPLTAITDAHAA